MKPAILLATTCNWVSPARLAIALASVGFEVTAVCPTRNNLHKVSVVRSTYRYNALRPITSFSRAIDKVKPDLILPCDDLATGHLHELHRRSQQDGHQSLSELICRSIGRPESFALMDARTPLMCVAKEEGISAPKTEVIKNLDELKAFLREANFPLVLKADGTSSGEGVAIVNSPEEALHAFRLLHSPPKLVRTLKWMLVNHNFRPVLPTLLRETSVVNVQSYVRGREATSLIVCWAGEVMAELQFAVLSVQKAGGPASALSLICHAQMSETAAKIANRLQISGLYGFDFILENGTEQAYLIEMNPRTTQVGHLALGAGRDIPAALYAALTKQEIQPRPKITDKEVIVLFPQGRLEDPSNPLIRNGYHDVPWEEPDLVRSLNERRSRVGDWLSRQEWLRTLWGPKLPRL